MILIGTLTVEICKPQIFSIVYCVRIHLLPGSLKMNNDWVKTLMIIAIMIVGFWRVSVYFDNKFDQIDARLDGIDTKLIQYELWIEGYCEIS